MDKRIRLFEIMQQVDKIDLDIVFKWLDNIDCKYLCVLHDKDVKDDGTPKPSHYHIMVNSVNARSIKDISKNCDIAPQYIERGKSTYNNMLGYSFHLTDSCESDGKYIYDKTAVIKSRDVDIDKIFTDDVIIKADKIHDDEIKKLLYEYGDLQKTYQNVLDVLSPKDFAKYNKLFKQMREYRQLKIKDRNMQVIYITGSSGVGKTSFAKYLARLNNFDIFVSGSGKDILDGYDKQECIILDDLRADVFTKSELFKLTDNNTNSSVKSRYNNKDISNCKMLIITSIKEPHNLYNWLVDSDESFVQFARRINYTYIKILPSGEIGSIEYSKDTLTHISSNNMQFLKDYRINYSPFTITDVFSALGFVKKIDENVALKSLLDLAFADIKKQEENKQLKLDDFLNDNK